MRLVARLCSDPLCGWAYNAPQVLPGRKGRGGREWRPEGEEAKGEDSQFWSELIDAPEGRKLGPIILVPRDFFFTHKVKSSRNSERPLPVWES